MFKIRRNKPKVGDEVTVNAPRSRGKGLVSRLHMPRKWRRLSSTKKVLIVLIVFIGVAALGYAIGEWVKYDRESQVPSKNLPTEKEFLTSNLAELLANPPDESASDEEKTKYYDELTLTYADKKQYDKAVQSFMTREAISTKGLKFHNYMNLAQYQYQATGDRVAALAALDKAEAALKSDENITDEGEAELLKHITALREGYAQ